MRVLAIGEYSNYNGDGSQDSLENGLDAINVIGLAGILDPPRKDVPKAIHLCQQAGIMVKMITGDHPC